MKSEQEIKDKIRELNLQEHQALGEDDIDCAIRVESIIKNLLWILGEDD